MSVRKPPPLSRYIETLQGDRSWGKILDAGTGVQSIRWIASLKSESWTAISASPQYVRQTQEAVKGKERSQDRILIGNWIDPNLLKDERFDTVIADYLLGSVEGFSPYFQPYLFSRLRQVTAEGGRFYLKGLEPYVPIPQPDNKASLLIWEIGRYRDACILMGGDIPYREYPAAWVVDHLQVAGFKVRDVKHHDIRYKSNFVNAQIDICLPILEKLEDQLLAVSLKQRGETLRARALEAIAKEGSIAFGRSYAIMAEPV